VIEVGRHLVEQSGGLRVTGEEGLRDVSGSAGGRCQLRAVSCANDARVGRRLRGAPARRRAQGEARDVRKLPRAFTANGGENMLEERGAGARQSDRRKDRVRCGVAGTARAAKNSGAYRAAYALHEAR